MRGRRLQKKKEFFLLVQGAELGCFFTLVVFPAISILSQNSLAAIRMSALCVLLFGFGLGTFVLLNKIFFENQERLLNMQWASFRQKKNISSDVLDELIHTFPIASLIHPLGQFFLLAIGFVLITGIFLMTFFSFSHLESPAFIIGQAVAFLSVVGMVKARFRNQENAFVVASVYTGAGLSLALISSLFASIIRFLA